MTNVIAVHLAQKALEMHGADKFSVCANLDVSKPESLQAYETFQNMLLMAYYEGQHSVLDAAGARLVPFGA